MKKKLTVNTLALGNLRARKKQYAIMLIGIILAMIFSSGILFYLFSAVDTQYAKEQEKYGKQDVILYLKGVDEQYYDSIRKDGIFTDYAFVHTIGYAYTDEKNQQLGTSVAWLDDKAQQISNQIFLEGAYPAAENEIAVEKTALSRMGYKNAKIGDTINVYLQVQNDNGYYDTVKKSYTLSGILSDKKLYLQATQINSSQIDDDIPAAFVAQNTNTEIGGKEKLTVYANFDYSRKDVTDKFYSYIDELKLPEDECYINFCRALKSFSNVSATGIYAVILGAVLALTSAIVIISSFNSNLKERKKQIGMLRAVGATKRQIINIFGREAFLIALITSPVAVAISYFGVKYGFKLMNSELVMTKSIVVLPLCLIVGIALVMIAALIPLISASRITPVQAIRDIEKNRKMKKRKIKSKKAFNVSSLVAKRSLAFSKGSIIAVTVILIATIVLSSFGFSYMTYAKDDVFSYDFDYELSCYNFASNSFVNIKNNSNGMTESDIQDISNIEYVSSAYGSKKVNAYINIDEYTDYFKVISAFSSTFQYNSDNLTYDNYIEKTSSEFSDDYLKYKRLFNEKNEMLGANIFSVDDNLLRDADKAYIDGKIDIDKLSSGEEVIIVAPKKAELSVELDEDNGCSSSVVCDDDKSPYTNVASGELPYKPGDKITVNVINYDNEVDLENSPQDYEKTSKEVTIGAIISYSDIDDCIKFSPSWMNYFSIITTNSGMNAFCDDARYDEINILCDDEISEDTDETVTSQLQEYVDMYGADLISNFAMVQKQKTELAALLVSMTAIIIVGFAMCTSIINNTLSARIRESKKEIGTLRAFGADQNELVKSFVKQLIEMFSAGTVIGFAAFIIGYAITFAVNKQNETTMEFVFNPYITVAFVILMFAVCSAALFFKIKKEMKNSIIDNIREL